MSDAPRSAYTSALAANENAPEPVAGRVVAIRLAQAEFGLPVEVVGEVLRTPPITRVPLAPAAVAGIASVRGNLVPVLDLGVRLVGRPAARPGRLVVVMPATGGDPVGLLVDELSGMVEYRASERGDPPPEAVAGLPEELVAGVVTVEGRLITLLDVEAVLTMDADRVREGE